MNVENQYCKYYSLIINLHIFLKRTLFRSQNVLATTNTFTSLVSWKVTHPIRLHRVRNRATACRDIENNTPK